MNGSVVCDIISYTLWDRVVNGLPGLNLKEAVDWSQSFVANYKSANETSNGDTGSCLEWSLVGLCQY
ncbi:hypothetical protein QYF36_006348 [Acer negundo]|nr:hypothetical protein QYF36_006348 [Acer negundo]